MIIPAISCSVLGFNPTPKVPIIGSLSFHQTALYKSFLPTQWVHGTPKSAIFIGFFIVNHPFWGSSHPHPGPIPFIPFIRDPGPNPNPMILPHVLELNGSKKLPNLRGGISCWAKKGHPFGQMMICGKKSSRMYVYYLFISFFKVNGSSWLGGGKQFFGRTTVRSM